MFKAPVSYNIVKTSPCIDAQRTVLPTNNTMISQKSKTVNKVQQTQLKVEFNN